jgi:glycosyltransferase involved in cell wall biosynthesis
MRRTLAAVFPIFNNGRWNAHTCLSICEHMRGEDLDVQLVAPASVGAGRREFVRDAIPPWGRGLVYRIPRGEALANAAVRRAFRGALRRADAAYLWAATPEVLYHDAKDAGVPLFVERTNCLRETARAILDEAYRRADLAPEHGIDDAGIEEERRKLQLADFVFAPSPMVERSLRAAGVPEGKVLPTSYGWSPERLRPAPSAASERPTVVLFVGTACIRKGTHLLLDAWARAGAKGRLEVCGTVSPEILQVGAEHLRRGDVVLRGHVLDVATAYASADVFAFPSLEEGGPLVTYEAASHGLAIVTTPMGAGAIVRDGVEGLVRDPYDMKGWVEALRRLCGDPAERARLGAAARARAQEFTWSKVGARRRAQVLQVLTSR